MIISFQLNIDDFYGPHFFVSLNLHLTQAKRDSLCRHKTTSPLFEDAIVVLKMISALEGCVYLVSCHNHLRKVGKRVKKKS